jgi:hypothetical protein
MCIKQPWNLEKIKSPNIYFGSNNTPSMHNMNTMLWINHCQNITPPYYTLSNNISIFFLTMNVCDLQIKTQMTMGRKGTKTIAKHMT